MKRPRRSPHPTRARPAALAVALVSCALGIIPGEAHGVTPVSPNVNDREAVAGWVDVWVNGALETHKIPGAVVAVVAGGEVVHLRGYGLAERETGRPMNPETTLLRVGSLSKLVTAVAALQLVAEGTLDLHADVRPRLGADLAARLPPGITLHHLLTHTAGLGEKFMAQGEERAADVADLEAFFRHHLVPPAGPVGGAIIYSNQGITLAGWLVERAAGRPFAEQAGAAVFAPLGMHGATFLPARGSASEGRIAAGYKVLFGRHRRIPLAHWRSYPASSLVAPGADLARFMLALLPPGGERGNGPLGPGVLPPLTTRQESTHPRSSGMAYAFWEHRENGRRLLWHSGHMPGHRSALFLLPEERVGAFINTNADRVIYERFRGDFLDHFFPFRDDANASSGGSANADANANANANANTNANAGRWTGAVDETGGGRGGYEGVYRHVWYPRETFARACVLLGMKGHEVRVDTVGGGLWVSGDPNGASGEAPAGGRVLFSPAGDDYFDDGSGGPGVGFSRDGSGRVTHLTRGGSRVYERLPAGRSAGAQRTLAAVLGVALAASLVHALRRARSGPGNLRRWHLLGAAVPAGHLVFLLGLGLIAARGAYRMVQAPPLLLGLLLLLPPAAALLNLALLGALVCGKKIRAAARWPVAHITVVNAAVLAFLHAWKLLGVRY